MHAGNSSAIRRVHPYTSGRKSKKKTSTFVRQARRALGPCAPRSLGVVELSAHSGPQLALHHLARGAAAQGIEARVRSGLARRSVRAECMVFVPGCGCANVVVQKCAEKSKNDGAMQWDSWNPAARDSGGRLLQPPRHHHFGHQPSLQGAAGPPRRPCMRAHAGRQSQCSPR